MLIDTLSHFTPGGLESVVPGEVLERFNDEWPATKVEGVLAPYEGIYDVQMPFGLLGDAVG